MAAASAAPLTISQTFTLKALTELRFMVLKADAQVELTLKRGSAEVFGTPLVLQHTYLMPLGNYAVFSWFDNTEILLSGDYSDAYASDDTPSMLSAVNLHGALDAERERALASISNASASAVAATTAAATTTTASNSKNTPLEGPRVVICGPPDSGKSTLAKILLSYAVRKERRPIFIDLDPGNGEISIAGTISSATIDSKCLTVEEGPIIANPPLVYFFGDYLPDKHPEYFKRLIGCLMEKVEARLKFDALSRATGIIANTCGWVEGLGYGLLLYAIRAIKADVVAVMGDDRLLNNLKRDLVGGSGDWGGVKAFVKIQRSAGVVIRSESSRGILRDVRFHKYFWGSQRSGELSGSLATIPFDSIIIFRLANEIAAADVSIRPVGSEEKIDPVMLQEVEPSAQLKHSILGVSFAEKEENVLSSNLAGFVHVRDVDVAAKTITFFMPCSGKLPGRYLLLGSQKLVDN